MKTLKILLIVLITTCSTITAQQKIKLKGLIINPETLEQKKYPKVTIGIKGTKKTTNPNKKGKFKLKGKGTILTIESKEYNSLEKEVPTSARKVLILVNEYKGLIKFLDKKEKFEDVYNDAKEEFNELAIALDYPVFPGCEGKKNQKHCFDQKIRRHLHKNFNSDLANELGLKSGRHRIISRFKIDENGMPIEIEVRAPHPRLKREVERVIKKLPKITPGMTKTKLRKPVKVEYILPVTFAVE